MSAYNNQCVKGFLRADGTKMVNGDGEQVILRGFGVGNWMNPEGFMIGGPNALANVSEPSFKLPGRFERGRSMETTIIETCGKRYMETFWQRWMESYLQEGDIKLMADLGYNSVRLPLDARLLLEEDEGIHFIETTFHHLDAVLDWCEKYRIYAILDLHAAPGGQSSFPCDGGIDNMAHMFTEPESYERAMLIWEEIARRYKDRWIVGGYDLLNEPVSTPYVQQYKPALAAFYDEVIARIRKIDTVHMFTIEGAKAASDYDIFDHDYDPDYHNWCIHMHKYMFSPQVRELYPVLEVAERLNVPVWYGEGRSTNPDMAVFYEIAAYYGIGFNQWSWKACEGLNSDDIGGVTYVLPEGWDKMLVYFTEGGPRPSYAESIAIMDQMLENLKIENCKVDYERHRYTLRQADITLPAAGYDPGVRDGKVFSGKRLDGNGWGYRTEDGMKMVLKPGKLPMSGFPSFGRPERRSPLEELYLELVEGEYTQYTVRDVKEVRDVVLSAVAETDTVLRISFDGNIQEIHWGTGSSLTEQKITEIQPGDAATVKIEVVSGKIYLNEICF